MRQCQSRECVLGGGKAHQGHQGQETQDGAILGEIDSLKTQQHLCHQAANHEEAVVNQPTLEVQVPHACDAQFSAQTAGDSPIARGVAYLHLNQGHVYVYMYIYCKDHYQGLDGSCVLQHKCLTSRCVNVWPALHLFSVDKHTVNTPYHSTLLPDLWVPKDLISESADVTAPQLVSVHKLSVNTPYYSTLLPNPPDSKDLLSKGLLSESARVSEVVYFVHRHGR